MKISQEIAVQLPKANLTVQKSQLPTELQTLFAKDKKTIKEEKDKKNCRLQAPLFKRQPGQITPQVMKQVVKTLDHTGGQWSDSFDTTTGEEIARQILTTRHGIRETANPDLADLLNNDKQNRIAKQSKSREDRATHFGGTPLDQVTPQTMQRDLEMRDLADGNIPGMSVEGNKFIIGETTYQLHPELTGPEPNAPIDQINRGTQIQQLKIEHQNPEMSKRMVLLALGPDFEGRAFSSLAYEDAQRVIAVARQQLPPYAERQKKITKFRLFK